MGLEFREELPERVPDTLLVYRLAEPTVLSRVREATRRPCVQSLA